MALSLGLISDLGVAVAMATPKQPRTSTAAKKTTRKKSQEIDPNVPASSEPVTTAEPTVTTGRNAILEGNATFDIDDIRRRAYELYEASGRLEGQHEEHWYQAEEEFRHRKKSA
jgi:hypothetical protein